MVFIFKFFPNISSVWKRLRRVFFGGILPIPGIFPGDCSVTHGDPADPKATPGTQKCKVGVFWEFGNLGRAGREGEEGKWESCEKILYFGRKKWNSVEKSFFGEKNGSPVGKSFFWGGKLGILWKIPFLGNENGNPM